MNEFILAHIETLASIVTVLGGVAAMFKFQLFLIEGKFEPRFNSIENRLDYMRDDLKEIKEEIRDVKQEQQKMHTRLTWLEGFLGKRYTERDEHNTIHDKKEKGG